MCGLYQFYFFYILCLLAVMATENTLFFIYNVEKGIHAWLVVGNALGIATLDDTTQFVGDADSLFLYHLVVADDVEFYT